MTADEAEAVYRALGQLVSEQPRDLAGPGPISADSHRWLGRASATIAKLYPTTDAPGLMERVSFNSAAENLDGILREQNAHKIVVILHRALATAEQGAPAAVQGAYIPIGAAFDVFQVIGKVLGEAKRDVLIVDAYMGASILTDFAPLAPEGVNVRLLTDGFYTKSETLRPGAERWAKQFGAKRPLEVRLSDPRALHDRLIVIDDAKVWVLSQSLKDFAGRSPGTVLRVDDAEISEQKRHAYGKYWSTAKPL